jgi:hypothetical protein
LLFNASVGNKEEKIYDIDTWKSKYQFGAVHSKEITVPFSGEAVKE